MAATRRRHVHASTVRVGPPTSAGSIVTHPSVTLTSSIMASGSAAVRTMAGTVR